MQNVIIEAEQREYEARRQLELMENELAERQESLTACEAKIEELAIKNAELVEQIEKHSELQTLSNVSFSFLFYYFEHGLVVLVAYCIIRVL